MLLSVGLTGRSKVSKRDLHADLKKRNYQTKRRNQFPKWLVFSALALSIFCALFYFYKDIKGITYNGLSWNGLNPLKNSDKKSSALKQLISSSTEKTIEQTKQSVNPDNITGSRGAGFELEWEKDNSAQNRAKQTVFNDKNYQPTKPVNTIKPPPSRYYESGEARSKAQINEVYRSLHQPAVKRTIPWEWKSQKTHRSGVFTYTERNGKIETHTVCTNYKKGSFVYRDCRKAAKRYFKKACSTDFRAACHASDMIP